jgi:hypothetical protein
MELSLLPFWRYDFEVAYRFLKNVCTPCQKTERNLCFVFIKDIHAWWMYQGKAILLEIHGLPAIVVKRFLSTLAVQ